MVTPVVASKHLFADLNILYDKQCPKNTADCIKQAATLGFDTVAVNVELLDFDAEEPSTSASNISGQKGKKKKSAAKPKPTIPEPPKFKVDVDQTAFNMAGKKFRLFSRLTLALEDTSQIHNTLKLPIVQQYDILCVLPKTEEMFNTIIKKMDAVDMITVDITKATSWVSKKNLVRMAVEKGLNFEITYAPALTDSSVRRDMFINARDILRATKGKGLVLTSRAQRSIEIRSPFDVANMSILWGMTPDQGKRAVSRNCRDLILHAQSKRTIKGAVAVRSCDGQSRELGALEKLLSVAEFKAEAERVEPKKDTTENVGHKHKKIKLIDA